MPSPQAGTVLAVRQASTRLSLLGRFNLQQDGRAVRLRTRKEEALLAYLVLHPDRHTREVLAELFWGDTAEQQAKASLRAALADLRGALGPEALLADRVVVQFSEAARISVDALEFRAQAAAFLRQEAPDPAAFNPGLYGGELLAGHYDDWVLAERERLRQLYIEALLHMVQRLRSLSRYDEAIAASREVLGVDPAEERAHQHLIFLYAVTGNRPAALRQLDLCRRSLREELDVEPSPETLALVETITLHGAIAGTPAERAAGGAAHDAAPAEFTNLPTPLTSFIGRQREIAGVSELLVCCSVAGARRLVTLTGLGGSGKTRLAIQVARLLVPKYPDGVWWVDLGSVRDPSLVPDTVLRALGVGLAPGQPPMQALTGFLRERTLLLALDNCEHLAGACAHLVESVLKACPRVQVLATSREPLDVPGEQLWPVAAFFVPAATVVDSEALLSYDSVRLFVERARMHRPAFSLGEHNAAQVTAICRRLDGVPLAIELAAARVRTMEVDDILDRLQNRLRLLASGSTLAPPRHQTLRASIDWSYNLLSPAECLLLRRLAVFAGGCTLAAAETVCAGEELAAENVLDLLSRLVDRSLVVAEEGRYRFLETIREYALARLAESGEAESLRERHAAHFAGFLAERLPRLVGREQDRTVAEVAAEIADVRAAWDWAVAARRGDLLNRSNGSLRWYYEMHTRFYEGEAVYARAVQALADAPAACPPAVDPGLLASLRASHGYFLGRLGKLAEARRELEAGCTGLREAGMPLELGLALTMLGSNVWQQGDYAGALTLLEEGLGILRTVGDRQWISLCLFFLALVVQSTGATVRAGEYFGEALANARITGNPRMLSMTSVYSAPTLLALGKLTEARERLEEGLALARRSQDRWLVGTGLGHLGMVMCAQGDRAGARKALQEAVALTEESGNRWDLGWIEVSLGNAYLAEGDPAQAEAHYRAGLELATETNAAPIALDALAGFAVLRAQAGDRMTALELAGHVALHPASSGSARARAAEVRCRLAAPEGGDVPAGDVPAAATAGAFEDLVRGILA